MPRQLPGKTHLVYLMHNFYSPIDEEIDEFLAWLQPRAANGTVVKTVGEVLPGTPPAGTSRRSRQQDRPRQCQAAPPCSSTEPAAPIERRPADLPVDPDRRHPGHPLQATPRADPPSPHRPARSTLTFRLVVNDGKVSSTPSTVTVTVTGGPNQPPVAAAGPAQTVPVGATVQLDGPAAPTSTATR